MVEISNFEIEDHLFWRHGFDSHQNPTCYTAAIERFLPYYKLHPLNFMFQKPIKFQFKLQMNHEINFLDTLHDNSFLDEGNENMYDWYLTYYFILYLPLFTEPTLHSLTTQINFSSFLSSICLTFIVVVHGKRIRKNSHMFAVLFTLYFFFSSFLCT